MGYRSILGNIQGNRIGIEEFITEDISGTQRFLAGMKVYVNDDTQRFPRVIRKRQAQRLIKRYVEAKGIRQYTSEHQVISDFWRYDLRLEREVVPSFKGILRTELIFNIEELKDIDYMRKLVGKEKPMIPFGYNLVGVLYFDTSTATFGRTDFDNGIFHNYSLPKNYRLLGETIDRECFDSFEGVILDTKKRDLILDEEMIDANKKSKDDLPTLILSIMRETREAA